MPGTNEPTVSDREMVGTATSHSSVSSNPLPVEVEGERTNSRSNALPPAVVRLWRPGAQRNLRNQWSKLASFKQKWTSASSSARSYATSLVNAYLSQRYMPSMELGVLKDMADIRNKACQKLLKQQELHQAKLISSYREMVAALLNMITVSSSMRCYIKGGTRSPLIQFSSSSEEKSDSGDGGGIPVFTFWSIPYFEKLASELVEMFQSEICLKRLIIFGLLSLGRQAPELNDLNWSNELYSGEFSDLAVCNVYSMETRELLSPMLEGFGQDMALGKHVSQPSHETLKVYLTTWLAEVNIDMDRVREIFAVAGEEMHFEFS